MAKEYCDQHCELHGMIKAIHTAIVGDVKNEKSEGLKAKVMRHDARFKTVARALWFLFAAVVASIAGAIWR